MDFLLQSLRPWNTAPVNRQKSGNLQGFGVERSVSGMSGIVMGGGTYAYGLPADGSDPVFAGGEMDAPFAIQRFPSVEQIFRLPSFDCIRRMSSIEDIRRMASIDGEQGRRASPQVDESMDTSQVLDQVDEEESEDEVELYDATTMDQSVDAMTPEMSPAFKSRRRARCDSVASNQGAFEYLDETRPWECESLEDLNTVPAGFSIEEKDLNLSLGDLRVLARLHVQRKANAVGIKLAAGMTNADLVALADSLGLYPLVFRLHLEAAGKLPLPRLHELYLDYKRESKVRAKQNKAQRDLGLAAKTRLLPDGRVTIDYFDGIALRLGRERDTIFRPLLHRVFREHKNQIRAKLAEVGLLHNEMRKWRDTQLCQALWVADHFVPGIWQSAVDVHLSKTKDFV